MKLYTISQFWNSNVIIKSLLMIFLKCHCCRSCSVFYEKSDVILCCFIHIASFVFPAVFEIVFFIFALWPIDYEVSRFVCVRMFPCTCMSFSSCLEQLCELLGAVSLCILLFLENYLHMLFLALLLFLGLHLPIY